jgi:hypothetical protein
MVAPANLAHAPPKCSDAPTASVVVLGRMPECSGRMDAQELPLKCYQAMP